MANPFYRPGELREAKVSELFAAIARRYDLMNDLQSLGLHRRWKRRVVQLAKTAPGERALDLCCGTGDLSLELARQGASVAGLDLSEPMLEIAKTRRHTSGIESGAEAPGSCSGRITNATFLRGDALRVPFRDDTFEIVTVGYGLRNLADWGAGLAEMQRVAKPGGRLLVLDFGKPDNAVWRRFYFGYLKIIVPLLGGLVTGNAEAYGYILESLRAYPAQEGVAAKMRALGCRRVRIINLLGGIMSINYGEKAGEAA